MIENPAEKSREIYLEKATPSDIPRCIEIDSQVENRTYPPTTTENGVLEEMAKGPVYMIKRGDEIVGTISYEKREDGSIYLSGLAIDPKYQGKGIGRSALLKIMGEVKDAKKIWLVTHPDNVAAVNLYQSLGFKVSGRKENYFGDGEPRIVLELIKDSI